MLGRQCTNTLPVLFFYSVGDKALCDEIPFRNRPQIVDRTRPFIEPGSHPFLDLPILRIAGQVVNTIRVFDPIE